MKIETDDFILNIDFCSYFLLSGWAINKRDGLFPKNFKLNSPQATLDLKQTNLLNRSDVAKAMGPVLQTELVGFSINLLDAFNDRPKDYGISIENRVVWTFNNFSLEINAAPSSHVSYPRELGSKQVLLIYNEISLVHECVRRLLSWQPNFLSKPCNFGVSYAASSLEQFDHIKKDLMEQKSEKILLIDKTVVERFSSRHPAIFSLSAKIILGETIDFHNRYGGLLNVACNLFSIPAGSMLSPVMLGCILSGIAGYAPLFFPDGPNLYIYQSGVSNEFVRDFVRTNVQEKVKENVVLIAKKNVQRISDINPGECTVFVQLRSLRFSMDIFALDPKQFVTSCLQRGLKVRTMTIGGV